MTRYTRGTKSTTHQRGNPGTATPWNEVQPPAPSRKSRVTEEGSTVLSTTDPKLVKLFGQFWVPQSDAKRLQKLITKLKGEGLSRKVISESLRDEIRRAEKKAKRSKDKTCFNCRQYGHLLIECPNAKVTKEDDGISGSISTTGEGSMEGVEICFKCGSTEHTSRRCTKNKDNENYKFAKCFICQGIGHISKQCSENKRGIYPAGGSCNECGDFNHLAKDCPKAVSNSVDEEVHSSKASNDVEGTCAAVLDPMAQTEYENVDDSWHKRGKKIDSNSASRKSSNPSNTNVFTDKNTKKRRVKF